MEKIIKHYTCTVSPTTCNSRLGKPQLGFTLIELMVVVAIIAIIAAIAFPSYQAYTRRSSESLAQQEMQKIAEQLERHKAKNFTYRDFDPNFIYDVSGAMTSVTLPRGAAGGAIKYTITIRDAEAPSLLLTDATVPPVIRARGWAMRATAADARSYNLLMTSTGLRCKNKTSANIQFNTTTKMWECGVGGENW